MKTSRQLIDEYIDESLGRAEARLKKHYVSVWAIVGYLIGASGDVHQVAEGFDVPDEAIEAAKAYYKKNKNIIDARREMNTGERPLPDGTPANARDRQHAKSTTKNDLIEKYIDESQGRAEARLKPYGVSVWAIVGYLKGSSGNVHHVAEGFDVPDEAIEAANAYYKNNKTIIDARREMNEA